MIQVIRHSDDMGITRQSTNQLLDAWHAGHLDSFSIIANGDATNLLSENLAATPDKPMRIAVHFNLTEGYSSSSPSNVPLLVNSNGQFRHSFGSLMSFYLFSSPGLRRELRRQIAIECTAQIVAIKSICGTRELTAIDGHNHIHMIPGVFAEVASCAADAGLPEIRISAEPFYIEKPWNDWLKSFWWINLSKHLLLKLLSISARKNAKTTKLQYQDAIIGILYSGRMTAMRALCGIKAATTAKKIEIVFHIGRAHTTEIDRWKKSAYRNFHLSKWRDIERAEIGLLNKIMSDKLRG